MNGASEEPKDSIFWLVSLKGLESGLLLLVLLLSVNRKDGKKRKVQVQTIHGVLLVGNKEREMLRCPVIVLYSSRP